MLHQEILTKEQIKLLPLVSKFSRNFGLVGGTAIALQIGHRKSIDFDLFTLKNKPFNPAEIKRKILKLSAIDKIIVSKPWEFTFITKGVQFTFYHYPFRINFSKNFKEIIKMPNLLTLGAMKAHALGQRAKWKDYVDLYFIMKNFYSLSEINKEARKLFKTEFNEKLFRVQLGYFDDIDYSQKIVYKKGFKIDDKIIKKALTEWSLS